MIIDPKNDKNFFQKNWPILILSIKFIAIMYPLSVVGYLWFSQDITEYLLKIIFSLGFVILNIGMLMIDPEDFMFEAAFMGCFLLIIIALFSYNAAFKEVFLSMIIAIFLPLEFAYYLKE